MVLETGTNGKPMPLHLTIVHEEVATSIGFMANVGEETSVRTVTPTSALRPLAPLRPEKEKVEAKEKARRIRKEKEKAEEKAKEKEKARRLRKEKEKEKAKVKEKAKANHTGRVKVRVKVRKARVSPKVPSTSQREKASILRKEKEKEKASLPTPPDSQGLHPMVLSTPHLANIFCMIIAREEVYVDFGILPCVYHGLRIAAGSEITVAMLTLPRTPSTL